MIFDRHHDKFSEYPENMAHICFAIGRSKSLDQASAEARDYFVRSLMARPTGLKTWIALLLTFGGPKVFKAGVNMWRWLDRFRPTNS